MTEPIALHVIVLHLADPLGRKGSQDKVLAGTPSALRPGIRPVGRGGRPIAPGMTFRRLPGQRGEFLRRMPCDRQGER